MGSSLAFSLMGSLRGQGSYSLVTGQNQMSSLSTFRPRVLEAQVGHLTSLLAPAASKIPSR